MKFKQIKISNAWEAEDIMLKLMIKQDHLIFERAHYIKMAALATRHVQYLTYMCKAKLISLKIDDHKLALSSLSEFLSLPQ